jgi:hypothetical protein
MRDAVGLYVLPLELILRRAEANRDRPYGSLTSCPGPGGVPLCGREDFWRENSGCGGGHGG